MSQYCHCSQQTTQKSTAQISSAKISPPKDYLMGEISFSSSLCQSYIHCNLGCSSQLTLFFSKVFLTTNFKGRNDIRVYLIFHWRNDCTPEQKPSSINCMELVDTLSDCDETMAQITEDLLERFSIGAQQGWMVLVCDGKLMNI